LACLHTRNSSENAGKEIAIGEIARGSSGRRTHPERGRRPTDEITEAAHAYLSRAGSLVALAQIDDIAKETHPVNLPGTVEQYPNWRRRLSLEELTQLCRRFASVLHRSDAVLSTCLRVSMTW
jgi:4-alpha-glucanotransferase